jgi:nicotinate-nucleotide adenylyltransferase
MCRTAASEYPLFEVSELELRRRGPSYTIDTVLELKAQGHTNISWLIGADMLLILPKWHRARELIQQASILVMARPGVAIEWDALPPEFRRLQQNVVEAPLIGISATEIRRRVRAGESIDGLTPDGVVRYIREKRLYQ